MAKLIYGLQQSLDGYVDHRKLGPPGPEVFRHFVEYTQGLGGMIYGSRTYEIMRYWDGEEDDWGTMECDFAAAWRGQKKWVVSKTLKEVGPNATLLSGDAVEAVRKLKAELEGDVSVGGPTLARSLTEAGLIDEYRLYLRPMVLGEGVPFFGGALPKLRLVESGVMAGDVVRLRYVAA